MRGLVNWFRIILVGAVFGVAGASPHVWPRWGLLGMTLTMIVIKIEEER